MALFVKTLKKLVEEYIRDRLVSYFLHLNQHIAKRRNLVGHLREGLNRI